MNTAAPAIQSERDVIRQYAEWYSSLGYRVSIEPSPQQLPSFLQTLAPDLLATRDGENVIVEIKTSSRTSSDKVQELARTLEHRPGWKLHVVFADLADPEWQPPCELPTLAELRARIEALNPDDLDEDQRRLSFLLIWSVIEAAARHNLIKAGIAPTNRISSSALIKTLLTEGLIEDRDYELLRRGLTVRNAIAHGFLNQPVSASLLRDLRDQAGNLLSPPLAAGIGL
jgi:hypothetical protein